MKKKQAAPAAADQDFEWWKKIVRTPEEDEWISGPNMRHK
jgi:hypothetical protein